jgi:hypothetical protein
VNAGSAVLQGGRSRNPADRVRASYRCPRTGRPASAGGGRTRLCSQACHHHDPARSWLLRRELALIGALLPAQTAEGSAAGYFQVSTLCRDEHTARGFGVPQARRLPRPWGHRGTRRPRAFQYLRARAYLISASCGGDSRESQSVSSPNTTTTFAAHGESRRAR